MRRDHRLRAFGLLLAAGAIPAALFLPQPTSGMLAFALGVTGLFLAVVAAERVVPAQGVQALLRGGSDEVNGLTAGIGLEGAPVYVPDQGNVGGPRLFRPASDNQREVPILDAATTVYAGTGSTKVGVAVDPAGRRLLDEHAAASDTLYRRAGLPEVEGLLEGLAGRHDLGRSVRVTREDPDGFRVRWARGAVEPPCFEAPADPRCLASGCALCQAAGCALAEAVGQPLAVAEADPDPPWIRLVLEPVGDPATGEAGPTGEEGEGA